eukprot:Pgem_evm1s17041
MKLFNYLSIATLMTLLVFWNGAISVEAGQTCAKKGQECRDTKNCCPGLKCHNPTGGAHY